MCFRSDGDIWLTEAPAPDAVAVRAFFVPGAKMGIACGRCLSIAFSRSIATSRSRTVPSWPFSHFSSSLIRVRSTSATIGEKNDTAVVIE